LVRQGLLKASWGTSDNNRRAKFYELTTAGKKRLREETASWNRLATAIAAALAQQAGGSMKSLDSLRIRIVSFFRPEDMRAEMEEELRSHIAHRADDLERSGLPRSEAERRARIEFGGREKYKEEIHQAAGGNFIARFFRIFVTACGYCASLQASPLLPF